MGDVGAMLGLCYAAIYLAAWSVLRRTDERPAAQRILRPTAWGVGLWSAVAVPSLLQFGVPWMLEVGERDAAAVGAGQWWRLFTSMFLQDGGWPGTAFNLVALAVTVVLVERVLNGPMMVGIFLVGGALANVLTVLLLGGTGAGNSMATMVVGLVAALVAWLVPARSPGMESQFVVLAAVAALLLAVRDQHGIAATVGLASGLVIVVSRRRV